MSERTLTEELQSVLRAHALDAPEPGASIAAILAETVEADGATRQPRLGGGGRLAVARARWRAANKTTFVAASVLVAIVLLAVGVRSLGSDSTAKSSSSAAAGGSVAGPDSAAGSSALAAPSYGAAQGLGDKSQSAAASQPQPSQAAGAANSAQPGQPPVFQCPAGQTETSKAVATLDTPALKAYEFRLMQIDCASANGARSGSDLSVYRIGPSGPAKVAQLIRPAQGIRVDSVAVTGSTRLTLIGEHAGATEQYTYAMSADRTILTPVATKQLTRACGNAAVAVNVVPTSASDQPGRAGLVRVLNTSASACNVGGYPIITPAPAPAASAGKIVYTLHGVLGGVKVPTYSTVRLAPGDVATALVEAGTTSRCAVSTALRVIIAPGQAAQSIPFEISTCALNVHPFVAGETGNA